MTAEPNEVAPAETEHSHSRIRKLLDEVATVVSAAESNGTFESHHRRELQGFLERLRKNFEGHASYEESDLFERVRPDLDDDGRELLERAVDQHETFAERLDRAERQLGELQPGAPVDTPVFRSLADNVSALEELWDRHDEVEGELLEHAGGAPDH